MSASAPSEADHDPNAPPPASNHWHDAERALARRCRVVNDGGPQIRVAAYEVEGNAFRAEKPRLWTDARYKTRGTFRPFDLHPDGQRFALAPAAAAPNGAKQDHVTVIFNVLDELRRIAPNR